MGILYKKVPCPLPPQIKFLDETLTMYLILSNRKLICCVLHVRVQSL